MLFDQTFCTFEMQNVLDINFVITYILHHYEIIHSTVHRSRNFFVSTNYLNQSNQN